jgi:hypothetical protein
MHPVRAVIIGLLIGVIPSLLIRALIVVLGDPPTGLPMVVVVVTSKPLPAGHVLTMDDITQVSIPESLVTVSLVKPQDASYVVNQKLLVPRAARDPLNWADFETMATLGAKQPARELIDACGAEMKRRRLAEAPDSVAALRAAVMEAP